MKLVHARYKNNLGQSIDVGDKVIVVRSDGTVKHGVYIGFTQSRWDPNYFRPYVLADDSQVSIWGPNHTRMNVPGKVRISSPYGKVYKLA